MATHESFLRYRGFRHLKASLLLLAAATLVYAAHDPVGGRSGGSAVGYALGALAAGLVLWLLWFGVRKRRYALGGSALRGWLSAHVYLGATLLLLVPLHAGFELGWNVHGAAYVLLVLVVASGMVGVAIYAALPRLVTENRPGQKLESLLQQIADLDAECRGLAVGLPDEVARAAARAVEQTRIGGGALRLLSGREPGCPSAAGLETVRAALPGLAGAEREAALSLAEVLARKCGLLDRVRRDLRLRAILEIWLYLHVPFSIALLAALVVHVVAVFLYR